MSKLLTIQEVSELLKVKVSTLYDWIYRKKIRYVKIGRLVRFYEDDIANFLKVNTVDYGTRRA